MCLLSQNLIPYIVCPGHRHHHSYDTPEVESSEMRLKPRGKPCVHNLVTTAHPEDIAQGQLETLVNENLGTQRMRNVTFRNSNQPWHMCLPNDCCDSCQGSCGYGVCLNGRLTACLPCAATQPPPCHSSTSPLLHVSPSMSGHAHTPSWALRLRELQLCTLNLPTRPTTWERALCVCPAVCTALLQFLATELQPPHQSTLPCASACLFKYTSLVSNLLFSPRRLQLFPYLPFSFSLASLRCISAFAHSWYQTHCKGLWFMWKEGTPEGKIPKHLP